MIGLSVLLSLASSGLVVAGYFLGNMSLVGWGLVMGLVGIVSAVAAGTMMGRET